MRQNKAVTTSAVLLLLTACSMPGSGTSQTHEPLNLAAYESQSVDWAQCPDNYFEESDYRSKGFDATTVTCATVDVPAMYVQGYDLPDFKIAMMRTPATGSSKLGTLFINPGGPGESGIVELQYLDFPTEIRESYDIIGFDPRGVNFSAPASGHQIKCNDMSDYKTYWTGEDSPANDAEAVSRIKDMNDYYSSCSKDNPGWWTLSTSNVVDDLELLRKVLTADAPLNFLGSSYGTTIASAYVTRFPEHVGRITLDSPTTNDPDSDAAAIAEATALEANVLALAQGYAAAKGLTLDRVKEIMLNVRQTADDDKLYGYAGIKVVDASQELHLSTEYMFTHGIRAMTYRGVDQVQDDFNKALDDASSTDIAWNGIFEWYALDLDGYDTSSLGGATFEASKLIRNNSFEIMAIVNSMDLDTTQNRDKEHDRALREQVKAVSPFWTALNSDSSGYEYNGDQHPLDWIDLALKDPAIPDPPTTLPARTNTSGKRVLVVGSRSESTTPWEFAKQTAADLDSPLITFEGSEHAPVAAFTHECLNKIFVDFYIHGVAPDSDTTCSD
jgi:pimeloyl-ACP methyl ester carboxylesterase